MILTEQTMQSRLGPSLGVTSPSLWLRLVSRDTDSAATAASARVAH